MLEEGEVESNLLAVVIFDLVELLGRDADEVGARGPVVEPFLVELRIVGRENGGDVRERRRGDVGESAGSA